MLINTTVMMLMNAAHPFMAVHITVSTPGDITTVHVNRDMSWVPMGIGVTTLTSVQKRLTAVNTTAPTLQAATDVHVVLASPWIQTLAGNASN
jgi:hypothetical protein